MAYQSEMGHAGDVAATPHALMVEANRFDAPPEVFVRQMLATQCQLAPAEAAVLWRRVPARAEGEPAPPPQVIAVHPQLEPGQDLPWWARRVGELVPEVAEAGTSRIEPLREPNELYGVEPQRYLVLVPLWGEAGVRGVAGYVVDRHETTDVRRSRERLELTAGMLSTYEVRATLRQRHSDLYRLRAACEVLAAVNAPRHFRGAAMALCNELATRFDAERVSLGFQRGRYVKVLAMSHTEKVVRKMQLVQAIESAMEECLDQDVEVAHPLAAEAPVIGRAAKELGTRHGPSSVVSLPIRHDGQVVAVLTLERPADRPWTVPEVETLRLTLDLCSTRVVERHEADRWVGARLARSTRRAAAWAVGAEHTWVKLTVIAVVTALALLVLVQGPDRVRAPFVLETTDRQVIAAPFDGYLAEVHVEPGDHVIAGVTVLASLDLAELELEAAAAHAELSRYRTEHELARRDGRIAQAQMAAAQAQQAEAQLRLLEFQLQRGEIIAPVDGLVMEGDLRGMAGAPVERGQVLFEVAPLETLRARLKVTDQRIRAVEAGQTGELAAASHPGDYLPFRVEQIYPIADVEDGRNVFPVRAELLEHRTWLRPRMEGVAKIDVGRAPYGWLWTREAVNWVRMTLWL